MASPRPCVGEGEGPTSLVIPVNIDLRQVPQQQTQTKSLDRRGFLGGGSIQADLKGVKKRKREKEEASAGSSVNRQLLPARQS